MKAQCGAFALAVCSVAATARAQDTSVRTTEVLVPAQTETYDVVPQGVILAPRRAFEISVGAAYTQPWGDIAMGRDISGDVGPGFSPSLELGYRVSPHWSIGVAGQYHESTAHDALANGSHVRGFAVNVDGTYHFAPYRFADPYLQIGTGYRALWILPTGVNNNDVVHGFELGRLQVGVDYRVSKDVALGPYVAADLNLFAWQDAQDAAGTGLENKRVNTFLTAGVMGRFDVGGTRAGAVRVAVTRPAYFEARTVTEPAKPQASVTFEAQIVEKCGVSGEQAFFNFDSSDLGASDDATLDTVAACLTTGALKGREIVIVGHADPRGTKQYNKGLGERRAEAVRAYLVSHGVTASTIYPKSRGEKDAVGTDEASWALDRRVDIRLKP